MSENPCTLDFGRYTIGIFWTAKTFLSAMERSPVRDFALMGLKGHFILGPFRVASKRRFVSVCRTSNLWELNGTWRKQDKSDARAIIGPVRVDIRADEHNFD